MRNDLLIELYLGEQLGWVDVSADGRQGVADSGGGITINRQDGDAGTMDLVLASPGGKYSPRNPRSPYYGLLGRNTPVRFGIVSQVEQFDVNVPAGWGPPWEEFGIGGTVALADWLVTGGTAVHLLPTDNAYRATAYKDRLYLDAEVRTQVTVDRNDIGGGAVEPANVFFRRQAGGTGEYYMTRVEVLASQDVRVSIHHSHAGVIAAPVTVAGLVYAGQPLEVAASCVGDRLAVKVWPAGSAEPRDWQLTGTDTRITTPGQFGLRSGVAAGNTNTKPIRFSYSNLRVIDRRAHMEVSEWPSRWNTPGTDSWVPIQAAGILRRLSQGAKPLDSALFRFLTRANPTAYWPLEDPAGSLSARSAVPGVPPMTAFGFSRFTEPGSGKPVPAANLPVFGSGDGIPGSLPVVDLAQGGVLQASLPYSPVANWKIEWVMRLPRDKGAIGTLPIEWRTDGSWGRWQFTIFETSFVSTFGDPDTGINAGSASATLNLWDGLPHHVQIEAFDFGDPRNVDARVYIDGFQVAQYTPFSGPMLGTSGSITKVILNPLEIRQDEEDSQAMPIMGHVAVWNPPGPLTETASAMLGHAGETAADRIERLCAEQGVPVFVSRGPDPSPAMGAQRPATFLDLLRECADVDMGILGEAREQLALTYRCLGSLYNQTPVELDYTHLAPPLDPVDDDALVRNDVTASRPDGGTARAVLEVGPLSTAAPPDGVGVYDTSVTVNVASDGQLPDQAGWRLHLGTQDDARYPTARVNLAAPLWQTLTDLAAQATALADGDLVELGGLPDWLPPGPALSMVHGSVEQVDEHTRTIGWTWLPAGPYTVATVDGDPRVAADGSTLAADLTGATLPGTVWDFTSSSGVMGWTGLNGSVAISGGQLLFTPGGSAASVELRSANVPAVAGRSYTGMVRATCAVSRTVTPFLIWRTPTGTLLSSTSGTPMAVTAGVPFDALVAGVAPAGAGHVQLMLGMGSTPPATHTLSVDVARLVEPQTMLLSSTAANGPWTTDPADMPLDIRVGGERVTAAAIGPGVDDPLDAPSTGGWGTTPTGETWTTAVGSAANMSVSGGFGRHSLPGNDQPQACILPLVLSDFELLAPVRVPVMPAGAQLLGQLLARWANVNSHYRVEAGFFPTGVMDLRIVRIVGGSRTIIGAAAGALTFAANQSVWVRVRFEGSLLRAKAWLSGSAEPSPWQVSVTDTTYTSGRVGAYSVAAGGNTNTKPVEVLYGSFTITSPQRAALVARGVNGFQRTWPAGTDVDVWQPAVLAL
ncbi:hypothetical protein [Micromonospora globbae]|uniref:hypothetical protein n=1 Tax=Micromonospora globbae TaxID=1894969 RepID=UPI0011C3FB4D|nr:hypothetical protein [Micromonospora globbae]